MILSHLYRLVASTHTLTVILTVGGMTASLGVAFYQYYIEQRKNNIQISFQGYFKYMIPYKIWSHGSSFIDMFFWSLAKVSGKIMLFTNLGLGVVFAHLITKGIASVAGAASPVNPGYWVIAWLYIVSFVCRDFMRFACHYYQHKVPVFWEFHKVHHSAKYLTPLTTDRSHLVQDYMDQLAEAVGLGVAFGIVRYFYTVSDADIVLISVAAWKISHICLLSYLQHSHIPASFGPLDKVLVCPSMHQIHHSSLRHHWDKNFGNSLSIWDRIFGTIYDPVPGEKLEMGLSYNEGRLQVCLGLLLASLRQDVSDCAPRMA